MEGRITHDVMGGKSPAFRFDIIQRREEKRIRDDIVNKSTFSFQAAGKRK